LYLIVYVARPVISNINGIVCKMNVANTSKNSLCAPLNDNIPSKTIPLTKDNINLVSSQSIKGIGKKKKEVIISYLDKITHLDDLLSFKKIGVGK
jgi:hypothetical protein